MAQNKPNLEERTVVCDGFKALNVRKSPNMASEVVGELKNGEKIMAEPPKRGWCKVENGYVRAVYLA